MRLVLQRTLDTSCLLYTQQRSVSKLSSRNEVQRHIRLPFTAFAEFKMVCHLRIRSRNVADMCFESRYDGSNTLLKKRGGFFKQALNIINEDPLMRS